MVLTRESANFSKLTVTYQYVFKGLIFATLGVFLALPYIEIVKDYFWLIIILEIGSIIWLAFNKNELLYYLFTFLTGLTLALLIDSSTTNALVSALASTTLIVGGLTFYASTTKHNYLNIGIILFYVLLGLVVAIVVNIFLQSSLLATSLSAITVLLFSVYIIYDTQQVLYTDISPLEGAINLYLDILNMFTSILRLS